MTSGADKPSDEATARARTWLESTIKELQQPVDPLEGMTIHVQASAAKLTRGGPIPIWNLFVHGEFEVTVATSTQRVRFDLDLPEWLEALTKFLRSSPRVSVDELLRTGSGFAIACAGNTFRVDCYDKDARSRAWVALSEVQLRALHARLVAELVVAAHRAADGYVEIDGLELLDIGMKASGGSSAQ